MRNIVDGDLRSIFMRRVPGHWQTIHLGAVGPGVPDANVCVEGIESWIEFKQTEHWAVEFRPQQPAWIHRRSSAGGRVWIAVRRRRGRHYDELWMVPGTMVRMLAAESLESLPPTVFRSPGGPKSWDWAVVSRLLSSPGVS